MKACGYVDDTQYARDYLYFKKGRKSFLQIKMELQKFISQIMTSKSPVRACEDVDDTALSYAEIKALATGNPHIKEKMDLDVQVSKLKLLKANHTSQIYRLESDIAKNFPVQISALKERIAGMQVDSQVVKSVDLQDNDTFAMTVGNVLYEDKKEAGEALIAACAGKTVTPGGAVEILDILGREESLKSLELGLDVGIPSGGNPSLRLVAF